MNSEIPGDIPNHEHTMSHMNKPSDPFLQRLDGKFVGILQWDQLDALWETINDSGQAWYLYQVGLALPELPLKGDGLRNALGMLNELLHQDHEHDYCGIVYADDPAEPTLVKVYDPNNLGYSCGSSGLKIPPRWILSLEKPSRIEDDAPTPNNRKRWWARLFG